MSDLTPIREPGIYDLPADVYHAEPCSEPSIGSTGLKTLIHRSPAHYWWQSSLNPLAEPWTTAALDFGRAAHELLLEGDERFWRRYAVRPDDARGNFTTKAGKAWRDEQQAAGRTILDRGADRTVMAIAESLRRHPVARTLLTTGEPEKSLIWRDAQTGAWLRARPDMLPANRRFIPDLKTVEDASPEAVRRAMHRYGWHESAAVYLWGIRALCGVDPEGFYLVCCEKAPPHAVAVYEVGAASLELGRLTMRRAVDVFAHCLAHDEWPGYFPGDHVEPLDIPEWAQRQQSEAAGDPHDPIPDVKEQAA